MIGLQLALLQQRQSELKTGLKKKAGL